MGEKSSSSDNPLFKPYNFYFKHFCQKKKCIAFKILWKFGAFALGQEVLKISGNFRQNGRKDAARNFKEGDR